MKGYPSRHMASKQRHINVDTKNCGFPGYKPVPPGWFKICVVGFITGTPKGSPKVCLWRSRESNLRPLVYKT